LRGSVTIARRLQAPLIAAVLALTLAASAGTAWADSTGVSWDDTRPTVEPLGNSWE